MIEGDWDALQEALAEIDERIAALQLALRRGEEDSMGIIQALEERVAEIEANDYNAAWDNLRDELGKRIEALEQGQGGIVLRLIDTEAIARRLTVSLFPPSPPVWTNRMDATQALSVRCRDTFIPADRVAVLEQYCATKWNWKKDPRGKDAIMFVRSLADQGRLTLEELNSICLILGVRP